MSFQVLIPLLNPNEPEALLASLQIAEGQTISQGDLLCTLETTKSASELYAEADGYVIGLRVQAGDTLHAGDVLCYLSPDRDWTPPEAPSPRETGSETPLPDGVRISRPALDLAREKGLDLSTLPVGPLITREMVERMAASPARVDFPVPASVFDSAAIIVYGGGGHGKAVIDLLRALRTYRIVGVVDDGMARGEMVMGVPVLGGSEVLSELAAQGVRQAVNAVGGIGNVAVRVKVFQRIAEAGFVCPAVVHPTAFVEPSATLAAGAQVFPHAYVGSEAEVGFGVIVNTGAIVSHECAIDAYANISPGAILAGDVKVGVGALVGMGVTVNLGVRVGARARIGNGATVKAEVPEGGIVRAGGVWPD
ncbi:MAG: NeuD/PglB/VioB family sugar acetyltransferase [Anaerolineales bacterium]|nr:NeuD/PglB/VioB family sugar acetyltransferase [Anaerolineales bacterium]